MPIVVNLDMMLARRKMPLTVLSTKVGRTITNLSVLKTNKAKSIRFDLLDKLCIVLECKPSDILEYMNKSDFDRLFSSNKI